MKRKRIRFADMPKPLMYLLVTSILLGCSPNIQCVKDIPQNPTSYTFQSSIQEVERAIMDEFSQLPGYRYMRLEYPEKDVILSSKAEAIFKEKSNQDDFYLHYSGSIGESKLCNDEKGMPLPYYADFHLHITALDSNSTKVEVLTIEPKVVVGSELLPSLPHFARKSKTKSVSPSTVEEYEILLRIGSELGENRMPALQLPN